MAKICHRERINASHVVTDFIKQWVQTHADGNSTFVLDQFEDTNMTAVPAVMRDNKAWGLWIQQNKDTVICRKVIRKIKTIQTQYSKIVDVM